MPKKQPSNKEKSEKVVPVRQSRRRVAKKPLPKPQVIPKIKYTG